jgi:hypothetical protein
MQDESMLKTTRAPGLGPERALLEWQERAS